MSLNRIISLYSRFYRLNLIICYHYLKDFMHLINRTFVITFVFSKIIVDPFGLLWIINVTINFALSIMRQLGWRGGEDMFIISSLKILTQERSICTQRAGLSWVYSILYCFLAPPLFIL